MTTPKRHPAGIRSGTFLVTSSTWARRDLFRAEPWARLFLDVLAVNRKQSRLLLHAFTLMPNHFHIILTVAEEPGLEKAVQYIKGGFSFRAGRELGSHMEVWQRGIDDQWIKDEEAYVDAKRYVVENAVRAGLVAAPEQYPYCSASSGLELDPAPCFETLAVRHA